MLISPVATYIGNRFSVQLVMNIGALLETTSLVTTSLVRRNWQLFLAQGVCFGFGMGCCFVGSVGIVSQWFCKKRSLSNGIAAAGSGTGGLIYSLSVGAMIPQIGFLWAMRALGIISFVIILICGNLLRTNNSNSGSRNILQFSVFRNPNYVALAVWGILSGFGYVSLLFSLSSYTVAMGFSEKQGSVASALLNLGQIIGRPAIGWLSDSLGRTNVAVSATFIAGFLSLVMWPFATSIPVIYTFAIMVGLVAGTLWATASPLTAEVVGSADISGALGLFWFILTPSTAVAEAVSMKLVGTGFEQKPYLGVQLLVGFMYAGAAVSLLLLKTPRCTVCLRSDGNT